MNYHLFLIPMCLFFLSLLFSLYLEIRLIRNQVKFLEERLEKLQSDSFKHSLQIIELETK